MTHKQPTMCPVCLGKDSTLSVDFDCFVNSDRSIRIVLYAKCSNCFSVWKYKEDIIPLMGDK